MFGFANTAPRLNGQQMLSQQMQGLNQQMGNPVTSVPGAQPQQASQGAFQAPQGGQVNVDPQKIWNGLKGFLPGQGQAAPQAAPYDPSAMTTPQVAQMPATGTYNPAGLSMNGSTPMASEAGGSFLSDLASLFGV